MSELKNIELLNEVNEANTSFISLELLSAEISDSTTELQITTDKMRFIINQMLNKADDISAGNDDVALMNNAEIGKTLSGYTDVLFDYLLALEKNIDDINNKYTPEHLKESIKFKKVETVKRN